MNSRMCVIKDKLREDLEAQGKKLPPLYRDYLYVLDTADDALFALAWAFRDFIVNPCEDTISKFEHYEYSVTLQFEEACAYAKAIRRMNATPTECETLRAQVDELCSQNFEMKRRIRALERMVDSACDYADCGADDAVLGLIDARKEYKKEYEGEK